MALSKRAQNVVPKQISYLLHVTHFKSESTLGKKSRAAHHSVQEVCACLRSSAKITLLTSKGSSMLLYSLR